MKQKEFFGVKKDSEKSLYVRKGDNGEILVTKAENGQLIEEKDTVHLDAQEARLLGIQLLKLATEPVKKDGIVIKTSDVVENINVYQRINPDDTFANTACIEVNEDEETEDYRANNGLSPNFSIEGEALENLIAILAKIV